MSRIDSNEARGWQGCPSSTCEGLTPEETCELWRCMLELQQRYRCYNSTRIHLAADAGEDGIRLMRKPSPRTRVEPPNNSLPYIDAERTGLPDEGWRMLRKYLRQDARPKPGRKLFGKQQRSNEALVSRYAASEDHTEVAMNRRPSCDSDTPAGAWDPVHVGR
ncbi:hypothetical protein DCS_05538 [Drechmeria coniospora]|uniref:Uncharacterized protein n=1 Tax=Drechmeria coniospora TaxID=98403 RepID=A0A151GNA9_DRECN|nr:hypothetical protein DCS_05538 [Drechmeria coniospora]KYK58521.1 hypothetical protein DCS_05538 [Drechmeria coniospora]